MEIKALAALKPGLSLEKYSYFKNLGEDDVLVAVKYCSLLRSDVFFIDNFWNDTKYPFVPSSEVFGVVVKAGKGVKGVGVGDFVGVGYQVFSCLKCQYCLAGKEQFCLGQRVLGVDEPGGLGEQMVVNSAFVYKIPEKLQKPEYVSLMGYGVTAFSACKHASLKPGARAGVVGVGNLGHLAVQILNRMEYEVVGLTHSASKQTLLEKLGAKGFLDPLNEKELGKHKKEFDFLLVTSYFSYNWSKLIELLTPEGSLCFLGLPEEKISFPVVLLADYARRRISGSYFGSRQDMKDLLEFALKHKIKSEIEVFPLSQANEVLQLIKKGKIPFNAVIKIS